MRKVLGASVAQVAVLLARRFALLVLAAVVIATPLAVLATDQWLSGFAYRIDLGVGTVLGAGALILTVALLTVSIHTVRAALADPVRSLRYE